MFNEHSILDEHSMFKEHSMLDEHSMFNEHSILDEHSMFKEHSILDDHSMFKEHSILNEHSIFDKATLRRVDGCAKRARTWDMSPNFSASSACSLTATLKKTGTRRNGTPPTDADLGSAASTDDGTAMSTRTASRQPWTVGICDQHRAIDLAKKNEKRREKKTNLAGRCVGAAGRGRHQDELDGGQIVDGDGHVGPHAGLVAVRRQQTLDVQQEAGARQQHQNVGVDRAAAQARHQQRHRRRQLPKSNGSTR